MNGGLILFLGVLAAWRLARDFVNEQGPFGLYRNLRAVLTAYAERQIDQSAVDNPQDHPWYWLYEGVSCMVCASFWSALLVALLVIAQQGWGFIALLLVWWGLAGGALFTEQMFNSLVEKPSTPDTSASQPSNRLAS